MSPDFITAAFEGDSERIEKIINRSLIDVNESDYDLRTALHLAASEGHKDVCAVLLSAGANINCPDRNYYTPLGNTFLSPRAGIF